MRADPFLLPAWDFNKVTQLHYKAIVTVCLSCKVMSNYKQGSPYSAQCGCFSGDSDSGEGWSGVFPRDSTVLCPGWLPVFSWVSHTNPSIVLWLLGCWLRCLFTCHTYCYQTGNYFYRGSLCIALQDNWDWKKFLELIYSRLALKAGPASELGHCSGSVGWTWWAVKQHSCSLTTTHPHWHCGRRNEELKARRLVGVGVVSRLKRVQSFDKWKNRRKKWCRGNHLPPPVGRMMSSPFPPKPPCFLCHCWSWCYTMWNMYLISLGHLPDCPILASCTPQICALVKGSETQKPQCCVNALEQSYNITLLLSLLWSKIKTTALYELLWRKLLGLVHQVFVYLSSENLQRWCFLSGQVTPVPVHSHWDSIFLVHHWNCLRCNPRLLLHVLFTDCLGKE